MRLARWLATTRLRLRSLFRRTRVEQDLDDEIRDHLERRIEADLARGLTREEAREAAMRALGGVDQAKEECRDARRVNVVEHVSRDVRFAFRHFARTPIVSATIVLVFALGIGFNTAIFLLIRAFVDGPVPGVVRQESLVRIRGIDRSTPGHAIGREFSYLEFREYAAQQSLFSDVAAWTSSDAVLGFGSSGEDHHSGAVTYVTASYFPVLGVRPILGAGLPADTPDNGPPVLAAVISHVLWERHFDRASDVIGRTIHVNGTAVTIAGVAPRRFAGARTGGSQMRVWLLLNTRPQVQRGASSLADYDDARFGIVARLQPGINVEDASATVRAIAERASQQTTRGPSPVATTSTDVVLLLGDNYFPPSGGVEEGPGAGRFVALVFPMLLLLIPCTSASALLAGVTVARQREIAVRLALGAARRRIIRQLVTESVLLALAAGATSLAVIWMLARFFDASIPSLQIEFDWSGTAFTFALSLLAGILFGISPALNATRVPLSDALKDSTGGVVPTRLRLQAWLVVAQIAVTQPALLIMGTLLLDLRSDLHALPSQAFADRIVSVRFNTNPRYGAMDRAREQTLQRLQARLAAVPGVSGVVAQDSMDDSFDVEVHPADRVPGVDAESSFQVRTSAAPEGYFPLMGMSFVRGRDFEPAERDVDGAIVIDSDLARRLWGTADPLGRRLVSVSQNRRGTTTFSVIGVVDDGSAVQITARRDTQIARIFMPWMETTGSLLIRTHGAAEPLLPTIRAVALAEAPELPVIGAETLAAVEASERRSVTAAISGAGGAGGVALLLSAIGLYAVAALAVGQRRREIGIRTALGADNRQVVWLFVRRGLRLSLTGLAIGLPLGVVIMRVLTTANGATLPAGIEIVAALAAAFVVAVALAASWIPARRAARVDPLEALRAE